MILNKEKTNEFVTNPGSRYKNLYKATLNDRGNVILKENGKQDLWEAINAEKDKCDMAYILRQMRLGDFSALDNTVQYLDLTEFPKSRRELLDVMINVENEFLALPVEVRQKFNNNFMEWYADGDTAEWREKMAPVLGTTESVQEVKDDAVQE